MSADKSSKPEEWTDREKYLREQAVPKYVDEFVATLLKDQPSGPDAVEKAALEHALRALPEDARQAALKPYLPQVQLEPRTPVQQIQFSSVPASDAHFVSPAARQYSSISHNVNINVLHKHDSLGHAKMARNASIVSYNTGALARDQPWYLQRIKVCATLGPKCNTKEEISKVVEAGASILRMNFSHGNQEQYIAMKNAIRELEKELERPLTIVADTRGPEIRIGEVPEGDVVLKRGQTVTLVTNEADATTGTDYQPDELKVFVAYPGITKVVNFGNRILLAEGNCSLLVKDITDTSIECEVQTKRFHLESRRNINLPGTSIDLPILTTSDEADLKFAFTELGVDGVNVSFVQTAENVNTVKDFISSLNLPFRPFIIAEIENQDGLENFDEILPLVDGVMVARGDLGAELPIKKLFLAQKSLISKCNVVGKPVIVASQLVDSMISNAHPTRAEANDVANAVLDGADCLQLSGETAIGDFPDLSVRTVTEVAYEAASYVNQQHFFQSMLAIQPHPMPPEESVASSAVNSASELGAKAIITLTTSGSSARMVSKYFSPCPVVAVCKIMSTAKMLNLVRGVTPYYYDGVDKDDRQTRIVKTIEKMKEIGMLVAGDFIVAVHADSDTGFANLARVIEIS